MADNIVDDQDPPQTIFPAFKRSILVTNLPYGIAEGRVREIFSGYGVIESVVMGPTEMTACVVYEEPWRAKQAVRRIRFHEPPLIIGSKPICVSLLKNNDERYHRRCRLINHMINRLESAYTLYLSNLSLTVTADQLREFFNRYGPVRDDPILYRSRGGNTLYGFVTFYHTASRRQAEEARGTRFHGRRMVVQPSAPTQFQLR